jgi:hypothetical protein
MDAHEPMLLQASSMNSVGPSHSICIVRRSPCDSSSKGVVHGYSHDQENDDDNGGAEGTAHLVENNEGEGERR